MLMYVGVSCGETIWATMPTWRSCGLERAGRANEKLLLNEMEAGRAKNKQTCKYQTNMCVLKPQQNPTVIFTQSTFFVRVAKFEHGEMPKSTNNPGAIIRVWPCRCLWSTGAAFQTRQKKNSRLLETTSKLKPPFYSHLFLDGAQALEFWHE